MKIKANYSAEIARTVKSYSTYRNKCSELEHKAKVLLSYTNAHWDNSFDVHCSYIPGDGLSFTLDTGEDELTMTCTIFFSIFKKYELEDITLDVIKEHCY